MTKYCFWIILIFCASCAISKKEKESFEKLALQPSDSVELLISDVPTPEMLRKFEMRAIQKLEDFYDYLDLLSDAAYDESIKQEIRYSATNLFYDKETIVNPMSAQIDLEYELEHFLEIDILEPEFEVSIGNLEISEQLIREGDDQYTGWASFDVILSKDEQQVRTSKEAKFCLRKIDKSLGKQQISIWEVFLGEIH